MDGAEKVLCVMFTCFAVVAIATAFMGQSAEDIAKRCDKSGIFMVGDRVYDCKPREVK